MSIRFGIPTIKDHDRPMSDSERSTLLTNERNFHKLQYRKGCTLSLCSCGFLIRDVTAQSVRARFEMHVKVCLQVLEDRLDGVSYGE